MLRPIVTFLLALAAAFVLTPLAGRLARRLGALDLAHSSRKIHLRPVPRLGGLAIVGAFFLALAAVVAADPGALELLLAERERALGLLLGALAVAGLGAFDDLRGASPSTKLLVEVAAAGLLYVTGYRLDHLVLPFVEPIALGWLGFPVTLLWIAGVTNAVNLIDGLDGLAAGVAAVAAGATALLALVGGGALAVLLAAALAGAALGFLRHNFNPASIFMGDTGSLFLGFVLAALSLRTHHESSTAVGLLASVLVLGLPLADTSLAIVRRAVRGAPIFRADRGHLHHLLLASGLGHRGAVLVLYAVSLLLSSLAVLVAVGGEALGAAVLVVVAVAGPSALWRLGIVRVPDVAALLEARRRNLALRADVRRAGERLRRAAEWGEIWPEVRQAAGQLGAIGVELRLAAQAGGPREVSYTAGPSSDGLLCTRSALEPGRGPGSLELRWRGRAALDRDTEIAVEILCGEVANALGRIRRRQRPRPLAAALVSRARSAVKTVWPTA